MHFGSILSRNWKPTVTSLLRIRVVFLVLFVSAHAAFAQNQKPERVNTIPAQSLTVDGASSTVDLSAYFSDPDGDILTYAAWSDDTSVVETQRTGTLLTIIPKAAGQTTVVARATDPDGSHAFHRISVSVNTLEIDIEIDVEPPFGPDLVVDLIRVGKTEMKPGAVFRMDAVIRNQGTAPSGNTKVRFYRSTDEIITPADTPVRTADLPFVAVNATRNKWGQLTAPQTVGVYYYGVCIEGVANESQTGNNCSPAIKVTVGTLRDKRRTPTPKTKEGFLPADLLAEQVFENYENMLSREDVKDLLSNVLGRLKEPEAQKSLSDDFIDAVIFQEINNPELLKRRWFFHVAATAQEIQWWFREPQVLTLLQNPAAIDELAKLMGISLPPPSVVFPDAILAQAIRKALQLPADAAIPKAKLATLTQLEVPFGSPETERIKDLTGLEHAKELKTFEIYHDGPDLTPLAGLTKLETVALFSASSRDRSITDLSPFKRLTNLRVLHLSNVDSDFTPLTGLTKLGALSLFGAGIDDNDLVSLIPILAGMKNLRALDLGSNAIRDATPLTALVNLKSLTLWENPVTDASLRQLKRQNPGLEILGVDLPAAPAAPVFPDETALLPNYPNPFNPETWIPYQLAKDADVTVTIYDIRGGVVRRLALGHQPAGFYYGRGRAAYWDGRNALGEQVASGLYFYTFTAGDFTATQKLLIRK